MSAPAIDQALGQLETACTRLELALAKLRPAAPEGAHAAGEFGDQGAPDTLHQRHEALRRAVAQGLGELDDILADLGRNGPSGA